MLEVGCGVGNTIYPLRETSPELFIHCCDFSPRAVQFVKVTEDTGLILIILIIFLILIGRIITMEMAFPGLTSSGCTMILNGGGGGGGKT